MATSDETRGGKQWKQKFKSDYTRDFPCIKVSRKGNFHAYCSVCNCDFSIQHGGRDDIKRHIDTRKHTQNANSAAHSQPLTSFFNVAGSDEELKTTKAEVYFTGFLVEHNLPLAAADHAGPLFRKMFPDSKIAAKYQCGRTKTGAIISELAAETAEGITEITRKQPYSLATDGSNDGSGQQQLYPVLLTYFNDKKGQVEQALLSMPSCEEDSTGENIFKLMDNELTRNKIPWENCLAFGADNASVMLGAKKGVAAFITKKNPSIYVVGCPCHMLHNTAKKAATALPVSMDEFLIDIYYYLDKSKKRMQSVKTLQKLCDKPTRKIIKHCVTRWLSLGLCLERLIQQWEPLSKFFKEEMRRQQMKRISKVGI